MSCDFSNAESQRDSDLQPRVASNELSVFAKVRAVRTGTSGSLSSVRNGGEGRGEEALCNVGALAMVKHPSPRPSPRSCLTGRGRRTRYLLQRSRHERSQLSMLWEGGEKTHNRNGVGIRHSQRVAARLRLRSTQPRGRKTIAQRFSAGVVWVQNQVPSGTKETARHTASVVPDGTFRFYGHQPSTEVLGYIRSSLRDGATALRSSPETATRPANSRSLLKLGRYL